MGIIIFCFHCVFLYIFLLFFHSCTHSHTLTPSEVFFSKFVTYCLTVCALLFSIIIACLFLKRIAHFAYTQFPCFVRFFVQSIFSRYCLGPFNGVLLILLLYILSVCLCACAFFKHIQVCTHIIYSFSVLFSLTHSFQFI